MKLSFNVNVDFQMSRGELHEIGSMIRTFREERNDQHDRAHKCEHDNKRQQISENRSQVDRRDNERINNLKREIEQIYKKRDKMLESLKALEKSVSELERAKGIR